MFQDPYAKEAFEVSMRDLAVAIQSLLGVKMSPAVALDYSENAYASNLVDVVKACKRYCEKILVS